MITVSRQNNQPRARTSLVIALGLTTSLLVAPLAAMKRLALPNREDGIDNQSNMSLSAEVPSEASTNTAQAEEAYGKLSLQFEANHGQAMCASSSSRARARDHLLTALKPFVLSARRLRTRLLESVSPSANLPTQSAACAIDESGARSCTLKRGPVIGIVNYFIGNDPEVARQHRFTPE